jgi:hypothetical protein
MAEARVFGDGEVVGDEAPGPDGETEIAQVDPAGQSGSKPTLDHWAEGVGIHEEANGHPCEYEESYDRGQGDLDRLPHGLPTDEKRLLEFHGISIAVTAVLAGISRRFGWHIFRHA